MVRQLHKTPRGGADLGDTLIFLTAISALVTTTMGYVVFSGLGPKAGLWDDLAFVAAALTFVWCFVRLLRDRAVDMAAEARQKDSQSETDAQRPRRTDFG